ncbi:uncharacterized protein LACBIDRAFT_302018 [Laccaria bicolor S238N-H82]|uniref:Predicted protein n=1 Tax=Laccaria bicolor (strain S238N-H82 / ATCC MYA-4686) TaxID=486041 RepID=B0CQD6_LACBS|nr:uncharacterized protein LACBIDRAFT_302018 [Laccaria bicolor S238N-H82]EDR15534.1 predicted protein [Laccaria bicolor S238N-H82]|eukprot:XP_001873742.1 predicted protein [Laccaria bicolor S238N-H82]
MGISNIYIVVQKKEMIKYKGYQTAKIKSVIQVVNSVIQGVHPIQSRHFGTGKTQESF